MAPTCHSAVARTKGSGELLACRKVVIAAVKSPASRSRFAFPIKEFSPGNPVILALERYDLILEAHGSRQEVVVRLRLLLGHK